MTATRDLDWWTPAAIAAAALGAWGVALTAQYGFDLMPCELCYSQRVPYALIFVFAGLALMPALDAPTRRRVVLMCAGLFAVGAGLALYHAGVEYKWWQGPVACTGTITRVTTSDLMEALSKPGSVACDQPAIVVLNISMAGYNFIAATILALASLWAATRSGWWTKP